MRVVLIVCFAILQRNGIFGDRYYDNYSLYEVTAYNERDRGLLYSFHVNEHAVLFFNLVTNQAAIPMNIMVKNTHVASFEEHLKDTNIEYTHNPEYLKQYGSDGLISESLDPNENFLTYDNILDWAQRKFTDYPNFVEFRPVLAKSHEKREMLVIKVTPSRKPLGVYIVGGDVARDWMSPAIVLNFVNRLIARFDSIQNRKKSGAKIIPNELFDFYDLYVVPVINPDGYVYSTEQNHRSWMKNRQTFYPKKICHNGRDAVGVNVDRNWHFLKSVGSENECNGLFLGNTALSEHECLGLFSRLNKNSQKTIVFIHVRGFGRLLTIPYANSEKTSNHDLLMEILPAVCNKLQAQFNETYHYGTTSTYFYNFTSNMADYIKKKLNIPIVLTVSLQHEDNFLPTRQDISLLTDHFMLIMNDTLMLAKDIYGPLFSRQTKIWTHEIITIVILISLVVCFYGNY